MTSNIRRRQRGVSIVEALVALVVLSVGMLGIANMYLESLRSNRTARARTVAAQIAIKYIPGTNVTDPGRYTVLAAWKEPGDTAFLSTSVEVMQIGG